MGASRVVRFRGVLSMKLVAVKHISNRLPKGSIFEVSSRQGRVLVAIKAARPFDEDQAVAQAVTAPVAPAPVSEPAPAPDPSPVFVEAEPPVEPAPQPEPEPATSAPPPSADDPKPTSRRGRSFPIGHRPA